MGLSKGNFWKRWWNWAPWPWIISAWASQVYWCVVLVYCIGSIAVSARAQSRKVQTNPFYVRLHLETTNFQTFLELIVSLPFSTHCSELWPKAAKVFPIGDFPLSTFQGKWTGLQFTRDATQSGDMFPACVHFHSMSSLSAGGPQHIRTNSPKHLSLVWKGVVCVGRAACNFICKRLQMTPNYLWKNFKRPRNLDQSFLSGWIVWRVRAWNDEEEEYSGFTDRVVSLDDRSPQVVQCLVGEQLTPPLWGCKLLWGTWDKPGGAGTSAFLPSNECVPSTVTITWCALF